MVAESARLLRASGGVISRIKVEDDVAANAVGQRNLSAIVGQSGESRGRVAFFQCEFEFFRHNWFKIMDTIGHGNLFFEELRSLKQRSRRGNEAVCSLDESRLVTSAATGSGPSSRGEDCPIEAPRDGFEELVAVLLAGAAEGE